MTANIRFKALVLDRSDHEVLIESDPIFENRSEALRWARDCGVEGEIRVRRAEAPRHLARYSGLNHGELRS